MGSLAGRKILVGVTGGIAAYKAAELVRLLIKDDAQVRVVMTEGAQKFITPLTLQALSQHPVATDTFDLAQESTIGHIALADWADAFVIAPASADAIARLSLGLGDDLLATIALACRAPLLVAPAMNVNMWQNVAVQQNLARLVERGARTVGPDSGDLACGWVGAGRMAEPAEILESLRALVGAGRDFDGLSVLVSAGPTWEAIDPVRYVGNRSSGKMGFAVAAAAARRGARVTLVAGPTALATPAGVERIDVESAGEMRRAVETRADGQAVIVMAAAVADYRPRARSASKLKKEKWGASPAIELERNADILGELGARAFAGRRPVLVGFAAETGDAEAQARAKLASKRCDFIVANDVGEAGSGFGTETNRVALVGPGEAIERLPLLAKTEVAEKILDRARALVKP